ncbi:MAG: glycosyltransferase [Chloroflexi bacterium]|nr:glycosyltransferase [Chloroflexota bacterium]
MTSPPAKRPADVTLDQPIKVVHLITSLDIGGAEMMLYKLLSGQSAGRSAGRPLDNVVICLTKSGPLAEKIFALGIPVYSLEMSQGRPTPVRLAVAFLRLFKRLRQEQPVILQTWLYHADLLGTLVAPLVGSPLLLWNIRNSSLDFSQYRRLTGWIIRLCALLSKRPYLILTNSDAGRIFHTEMGYRAGNWLLIPNGINTTQYKPDPEAYAEVRQELGLALDTPLIGLVARFDPQKDHYTFIQAARQLSEVCPQAHFILAGKGLDSQNSKVVEWISAGGFTGGEEAGLSKKIHLLGLRHDITRITAALDLATSSSCFGEGFPNVIGEAMACGIPCVVTDVGDSRLIVGETGKVVPARDPQALAKAWQEYLELPKAERQSIGERARLRVERLYSIEEVVSRYTKLYEELGRAKTR